MFTLSTILYVGKLLERNALSGINIGLTSRAYTCDEWGVEHYCIQLSEHGAMKFAIYADKHRTASELENE